MEASDGGRIALRLEERAQGVVATLVVDNPARLNAMGSELTAAFAGEVRALAANPDLRVLVVAGAGERAFIGGADIREMAMIATPKAARAFILGIHGCCAALRALPVPVIARIQGYAFGAGLELAAACDSRIAADSASFGMQEVRLGIPSVVEAALLPMLIGWGRTRRLLLTGDTIGAQQALAWGLVEEVAPAIALDEAVEACIRSILACGPQAVRDQKALIGRWESLPLAQAVAAGVESFAGAWRTDEPRALMAKFLADRAARKGAS
ncbi:MAG TPA: enoyl-CoA hydratase [Caulobacteraceae bacterium]|nr:enoyl-CoA hydratase [Caulobacteraceae bacterium]